MDIPAKVREFIGSNFYVADALRDDLSLLDTGILDSTGVLEVVAFLEEQFGIEVPDGDIVPENFETVAQMSALVARRLEQADHGPRAVCPPAP
jgi:acyl carrier protein